MTIILFVILILQLLAFFLIDFLFHQKQSAEILTSVRVSQRKLRLIHFVQLIFIILGIVYFYDISWTISALNKEKAEIDMEEFGGDKIRRGELSIRVLKAQRDWYVSIMGVVVNVFLYFYILLQRELNKRQDNVTIRRRSRDAFESKFLYRGKNN